jgi:hypothetical protein
MMRSILELAPALLLGAALAAPALPGNRQGAAERPAGLLAGEFDNFQQVWEERESRAPFVHARIHLIAAPVRLPQFGENVFYVQQYLDGDPAKVHGQYLFALSPSQADGAVVLTIHAFADGGPYVDAHRDPSRLASLRPADTISWPGCELRLAPEGAGFSGALREHAAGGAGERGAGFPYETMTLLPGELHIGERIAAGRPAPPPYRLKRCRWFRGWAVIRRGEGEEYDVARDLLLHDQGGRIPLRSAGREYEIELAQLVYQSTKVPIMKLALYEKGREESFAYTWSDPEAGRIGINLRWIQAGFTLEKSAVGGVR